MKDQNIPVTMIFNNPIIPNVYCPRHELQYLFDNQDKEFYGVTLDRTIVAPYPGNNSIYKFNYGTYHATNIESPPHKF